MLKTSQQIRDQIADERAKAQSIVGVAELEDRELTDDEQATFDHILADIENLEVVEANAIKREEFAAKLRQANKLQQRIDAGEIAVGSDSGDTPQVITVPARAKAYHKLTAYDNERDAYVAGTAILAGVFQNEKSIQRCKDWGIYNTMTEGISTAGGFLVPEEMQRSIVRLREERGVFPRYARNYPMASDSVFIPRDITDVTAYWVGETAEITASDQSVAAAELVAKKVAVLTKISTELDEDSVVDIGNMVTMSMAYALADKLDEAGFNGNGLSTDGGVVGLKNALNASAIIGAATGNDAPDNLDLVDFESVLGALPQYPGMRPVWFMHSAVYFASIARLMNASGGTTGDMLANGTAQRFMGYPVVFSQVMHSTTTTSASTIVAYFGDLSLAATVGNRRNMRTQVTTDRYFENDLIGIKCTERVAITVHEVGDTIRNRPILAMKTAA